MTFQFTKYRKIYYTISALCVVVSLLAITFLGLNPGIEFVGGSVIELDYDEQVPSVAEANEMLEEAGLEGANVQLVGDSSLLVRSDVAEEDARRLIMDTLPEADRVHSEAVSPVIGDELRSSALTAIIIASALVVAYIAVSFREDDGSVNSVRYGVIATGIAFLHDMLIIVGIFSILGYLYGVQVTIPITVALLTTLGYSINDTVVIFDRIRENLRKNKSGRDSLEKIVNTSLNQVLGRSVGTSVTTLCVLFALLFFGGATLYYFVLALILGVALGTYSSIFLAGCFLIDWEGLTKKRK